MEGPDIFQTTFSSQISSRETLRACVTTLQKPLKSRPTSFPLALNQHNVELTLTNFCGTSLSSFRYKSRSLSLELSVQNPALCTLQPSQVLFGVISCVQQTEDVARTGLKSCKLFWTQRTRLCEVEEAKQSR